MSRLNDFKQWLINFTEQNGTEPTLVEMTAQIDMLEAKPPIKVTSTSINTITQSLKPEFKKFSIICVDATCYKYLTENKIYTCLASNARYYTIKDDAGELVQMFKDRFTKVRKIK